MYDCEGMHAIYHNSFLQRIFSNIYVSDLHKVLKIINCKFTRIQLQCETFFLKRGQDIFDYFSIQSCCNNSYYLEIDSDFMVSIYLNLPSEYESFSLRNLNVI